MSRSPQLRLTSPHFISILALLLQLFLPLPARAAPVQHEAARFLSPQTTVAVKPNLQLNEVSLLELPAISIEDANTLEGNDGSHDLSFTVTLSATSQETVTVRYLTLNGQALAGSDYVTKTGLVTFPPGETIGHFTVSILGDLQVESNENFYVRLSDAVNATFLREAAVGMITNDDESPNLPTLSVSDASTLEGNDGSHSLYFTVTLSAVSQQTVTVRYLTLDGPALAGSDYVTKTDLVTFPPGETIRYFAVSILGDLQVEPNEHFYVRLSDAVNATLLREGGVGTILNDDESPNLPTLAVSDASTLEGNDGSHGLYFTVTLSAVSQQTVTVRYLTLNGTASAESDYVTQTESLTFPPGETIRHFAVSILGDVQVESNEHFYVLLNDPVNATLLREGGVGMILNDDESPNLPTLAVSDARTLEGNDGSHELSFAATLSAASQETVTVRYLTLNGTASAESDYVSKTERLIFPPGETTRHFAVIVSGDLQVEPDEHFYVRLNDAVNATLLREGAVGTIINDDTNANLPTLTVGDASTLEGNDGSHDLFFTATLSAVSPQTVTVRYLTLNGPALAGSDYVSKTELLAFPPGETVRRFSVSILGDTQVESDEHFYVRLSNPANATLLREGAMGTILNDDHNVETPTPTPSETATPTPSATPLPHPVVVGITPNHGQSEVAVAVVIRGANFVATPRVRIGDVALNEISFINSTELRAVVPAGMAPGVYAVRVCNPDEQCGVLFSGYTVTGSGPRLERVAPAQGYNNAVNEIDLYGFNFQAGLVGAVGDTALANIVVHSAQWASAEVPAGLQPGTYNLTVRNPNSAVVSTLFGAYTVLDPVGEDVFVGNEDLWTEPSTVREGDTILIGLSVHHQGGDGPRNVTVSFYQGDPADGGVLLGEMTTPPIAAAGGVDYASLEYHVTLSGTLDLYAVVDPNETIAETSEANNVAHQEFTVLPARGDTEAPHLTGMQVSPYLTRNGVVTVTLEANDGDGSGVSSMYLTARSFSSVARAWIPTQSTGWIPFQNTYVFTLTGGAGVRYFQAWVADRNQNISHDPVKARVIYAPAGDTLRAGQVRLFRVDLNAGDPLSVILTTVGGDADLYIFGPDNTRLGFSNNLGLASDSVSITASVTGTYQIEVEAAEDSLYFLEISTGNNAPQTKPSATESANLLVKTNRTQPIVAIQNVPDTNAALPVAPALPTYTLFVPILQK